VFFLENVNTFSVADRTRRYQPRQGVHFRPGTFDDQFDCPLPEEARTELLGKIPPPKPHRSRKIPACEPAPPPVRRLRGAAAVIGAITIAALFLYAMSRTSGPSTSTAPPGIQSVPSQPVEVRRALPVEVRRALPVALRALPLGAAPSAVPVVGWQPVRMPDGTIVQVSYRGELPSSASLPPRGRFLGEQYSTGTTSWVWMTPAGATFPSWVDP